MVPSLVDRQRVPGGDRGAAGGSLRKRLVGPPSPSRRQADGTQLAGSFSLDAAKSLFLGGEPRRPKLELPGCPWGGPFLFWGFSFSI